VRAKRFCSRRSRARYPHGRRPHDGVIRGATALAYVKRVETPTHVEFAFGGVASTLSGSRGRRGSDRDDHVRRFAAYPSTIVAFDAPRGFAYDIAPASSPYELSLIIGDSPGAVALNRRLRRSQTRSPR